MGFQFTGFSDEASQDLGDQINVLKTVGWTGIELRGVNGTNVCDLSVEDWQRTLDRLRESKIDVVGFGGQIANWARPIDGDFQKDIDELQRCAPRMLDAGTNLIRIMSYPNSSDSPLAREDWRAETIKRLSELAKMAEDLGVVLGHENCSGYGGIGPNEYLDLVASIDSPAFKLIFDTGNNSLHDNDINATWTYYEACRDEIIHVHIKSAKPGDDGKLIASYPDEDPNQARILADLAERGYNGWISIEPHLAAQVHLGETAAGDAATNIWVEYANRIEMLAAEAQTWQTHAAS
ncbi:MAG: sugar phosphate isomerase/epimerase [Verrucomicrobia bacterium]|nr:sugar phosphate isomerase/epimerase [Verrucomicrobiota bacterium]MDA1087517.1 sugar phosphate isomerase/epimerase [Verrucomicrobiota bacterium]